MLKIHTDGEDRYFIRYTTIEALRTILDDLRDTDLIVSNSVGNLSVYRDGEQIGFIDFNNDRFFSVGSSEFLISD